MASATSLQTPLRPGFARTPSCSNAGLAAPVAAAPLEGESAPDAVLEFIDGTAFRGISFGAEGKSVAGECVFQTGLYGWCLEI
jgi:carbamoyl-phosphate synthase / aspartate carbamoyltransferase